MKFTVAQIQNILQTAFPYTDLNNKNDQGYVRVLCPFHNDHNMSAGINPLDGYFRCWTCNKQFTKFEDFLKEWLKFNNKYTWEKLVKKIEAANNVYTDLDKGLNDLLTQKEYAIQKLIIQSLGINEKVMRDCKLQANTGEYVIKLPVLVNGIPTGFKYYSPKPSNPDMKSWGSVPGGLPIPFDVWNKDTITPTLICEGEKDMLVARSYGYNAICWGGGCNSLPKGWEGYFKDREVIIAYDNDEAGHKGADALAVYLWKNGCKTIKVLKNWHEKLAPKEDVTDWFVKHGYGPQLFNQYIQSTPYFTEKDYKRLLNANVNLVPLDKALEDYNINRKLTSIIQVKAEGKDTQAIPKNYKATFTAGEQTTEIMFSLNDDLLDKMLGLFISTGPTFKKALDDLAWECYFKQMNEYYKNQNENFEFDPATKLKSVKQVGAEHITIHHSIVGPYTENEKGASDTVDETVELNLYSREPLKNSQIYTIKYVPVSHQKDGYKLALIALEIETAANSIDSYETNSQTPMLFRYFQNNSTVEQKTIELFNVIKENQINHLDFNLWFATELVFNSPLWFNYKGSTRRGSIYLNIIGDTRSGKSELTQFLTQFYGQGKIVNTKLSTVDSLVGGAVQKGNDWYIQAGVLPRSNKSLLVLEELQMLGDSYFNKITEVKSSNKLNLNRVAGSLKVDCNVRLIEISNPKSSNKGSAVTVKTFPDGYTLIRNLIHNVEDIARNDIYLPKIRGQLVAPKPKKDIDPTPYQERIRWVWSRKPDQIEFAWNDDMEDYIYNKAQEWNKLFDCDNVTLLGTEAHEKLARLSIAFAAMLCSCSPDYQKIRVQKEHVDFIVKWLINLYCDPLMKIDKVVEREREYEQCTQKDIVELQALYGTYTSAIEYLATVVDTTRDLITAFSGEPITKLGPLFSGLMTNKFVIVDGYNIKPSAKFQQAMKFINTKVMDVKPVTQEAPVVYEEIKF